MTPAEVALLIRVAELLVSMGRSSGVKDADLEATIAATSALIQEQVDKVNET